MAVLKKLLNLLDELKEENPELSNRVTLAAETLKAGFDDDDDEDLAEPEEEFDDSYIVLSESDSERLMKSEKLLDKMLYQFGFLIRNQEVTKNNALEKIEEMRESRESMLDSYKEQYKCCPESKYVLKFHDNDEMNLVFVKKQD